MVGRLGGPGDCQTPLLSYMQGGGSQEGGPPAGEFSFLKGVCVSLEHHSTV